ncbi:craniofacial development protein 1 isoform X1 [Aquarana catesbeiana]|uniref:craniofacial development protein 1 isoform X1 n=1 Tax=Aquarana catesbeiana TaxID=8400 RepID=UPI003CC9D43C
MSDCDSEDYSSSDDEDYVPSGGEYSEDDVNDLVKEDDDDDEQEDGEEKSKSKKKIKKSIVARKRKKGVLVLNSGEGAEKNEDKAENSEEDNDFNMDEEKKRKQEEAKKKRAEDLWSSFLCDVGHKPKAPPPAPSTQNTQAQPDKPKETNKAPQQTPSTKEEPKKVTITRVFDFAGEEVRVTKEVDSSSKEAKEFIKQQEKGQEKREQTPEPARTGMAAGSGVKRPGGMSSILGKLGSKKQKMSTLEKSKLDWESFKEKEGISEELAIHNRGKDGYIERKSFLERVDYRQFELEREIRLKNMKPS